VGIASPPKNANKIAKRCQLSAQAFGSPSRKGHGTTGLATIRRLDTIAGVRWEIESCTYDEVKIAFVIAQKEIM